MSDQKEISPNNLVLIGVVGGLVGIYLTLAPTPYSSIFGALGGICAVIWGAEAIKRVSKYGLGTGVPSIGQLGLGMAIVASMFGLAIVNSVQNQVVGYLGPIVSLVTAAVIGYIIGLFAQHVIKMNIPVMIRGMTEIAAAGSLIIVGFSAAAAGSFLFNDIVDMVFTNGIVLGVFWIGAVAILHPFNATLGPDEKQKRTVYLAISTGSINMVIIGIAAIMTLGGPGVITAFAGLILWLFSYKKFWDEVYKDSSSVVGTGLIPETEA